MAPTHLVDFACYKPPEELRVDSEECSIKGKHWSVRGTKLQRCTARS